MPTLAPDVLTPIEALTVWLSQPETEQQIVEDTSLRVPRQKSERENGFRPWLGKQSTHLDPWFVAYKHQLAERIQTEVLITH